MARELRIRAGGASVKVSVIMAAYNVEQTIDEAIQSVLAQKGVSFELLIGYTPGTDRTSLESKRTGPTPA